jgi:hypothetical protein
LPIGRRFFNGPIRRIGHGGNRGGKRRGFSACGNRCPRSPAVYHGS